MASWGDLRDELNRWSDAGEPATLWWRDDDAADVTAASDRLLRLARGAAVPLHLAVIPALQTDSLVASLRDSPVAWVLQHGYAHINHAPPGEGGWEVGTHRPVTTVWHELSKGLEMLRERHGQRFLPILVPPWSRVAPEVLAGVSGLGFRGVSCSSAKSLPDPGPNLFAVHASCDPIKWNKTEGRFAGTEATLGKITKHLSGRRLGRVDAAEPTGLLTHHLAMDEATWAFVEQLIEHSRGHPGAKWIAIGRLLEGT
jgi:hypothetical protein